MQQCQIILAQRVSGINGNRVFQQFRRLIQLLFPAGNRIQFKFNCRQVHQQRHIVALQAYALTQHSFGIHPVFALVRYDPEPPVSFHILVVQQLGEIEAVTCRVERAFLQIFPGTGREEAAGLCAAGKRFVTFTQEFDLFINLLRCLTHLPEERDNAPLL
ncbi:hypothetical protein D3C86_1706960 [compost metagenome]